MYIHMCISNEGEGRPTYVRACVCIHINDRIGFQWRELNVVFKWRQQLLKAMRQPLNSTSWTYDGASEIIMKGVCP